MPAIGGQRITGGTTTGDHRLRTPIPSASFSLTVVRATRQDFVYNFTASERPRNGVNNYIPPRVKSAEHAKHGVVFCNMHHTVYLCIKTKKNRIPIYLIMQITIKRYLRL